MAFALNRNCSIKQSQTPEMGLALFATQNLSQGLMILSERALLNHNTREDSIASAAEDFSTLDDTQKRFFVQLFAGRLDMVPLGPPGPVRDSLAISEQRLQNIVKFNAIEGQGTGCILGLGVSAINHSCVRCQITYHWLLFYADNVPTDAALTHFSTTTLRPTASPSMHFKTSGLVMRSQCPTYRAPHT